MNCYISSSCSGPGSAEEIVRKLTDLDFRSIELTGNVAFEEDIAARVRELRFRYQADFLIHNYLPFRSEAFVLNLASARDPDRVRTREHIRQAIALSLDLGKDLYSIHPGFMHDLVPLQQDHFFTRASDGLNARETFHESLRYLVRHIVPPNFRIAVENLAPRNANELYSFLCTPEDLFAFLDEFRDVPNVGLLLDLAHLNVAARLLAFDKLKVLDRLVQEYGRRIFALHLSENDGSRDHHRITETDSWQTRFLIENKDCLKDINIVFEWQNSANPEAFRRFRSIRDGLAA